jgi:hypothetical protein
MHLRKMHPPKPLSLAGLSLFGFKASNLLKGTAWTSSHVAEGARTNARLIFGAANFAGPINDAYNLHAKLLQVNKILLFTFAALFGLTGAYWGRYRFPLKPGSPMDRALGVINVVGNVAVALVGIALTVTTGFAGVPESADLHLAGHVWLQRVLGSQKARHRVTST